jgi:hypothetical protein
MLDDQVIKCSERIPVIQCQVIQVPRSLDSSCWHWGILAFFQHMFYGQLKKTFQNFRRFTLSQPPSQTGNIRKKTNPNMGQKHGRVLIFGLEPSSTYLQLCGNRIKTHIKHPTQGCSSVC